MVDTMLLYNVFLKLNDELDLTTSKVVTSKETHDFEMNKEVDNKYVSLYLTNPNSVIKDHIIAKTDKKYVKEDSDDEKTTSNKRKNKLNVKCNNTVDNLVNNYFTK